MHLTSCLIIYYIRINFKIAKNAAKQYVLHIRSHYYVRIGLYHVTERFLHFLTLQLLMALHYHHNSFVLKLYSHNCILFSHSSAICSQVISHTSQMRCDAEHVPKQNTCIQILFKCLPFGEEVSHQLISATALCLNQP